MRRSALFFLAIALGAIALGGGLYLGSRSHQITYTRVAQGVIAHYLTGQGTGYLQMSNSPTLYIVQENSFAPKIDGTNTLLNGDTISFIYDSSSSTYIDQQSILKTHLVGNAYRIVQITLYDNNNQTVYTLPEYIQHPKGYYQNNWLPTGGALIVVGLVMIGASFLLPKKKEKAKPVPTMGEHIGVESLSDSDEQPFEPFAGEEQDARITSKIPFITLPLAVPRLPDQPTGASRTFAPSMSQSWFYDQSAPEASEVGQEDVQITSTIPYISLPSVSRPPEMPLQRVDAQPEEDVQITSTIPYIKLPFAAPRPPDQQTGETNR